MLCRQIVPRRDRGVHANTNLQFSLTKFDGRRLAVWLHGRSVFHVRILRRRAKLHTCSVQRPTAASSCLASVPSSSGSASGVSRARGDALHGARADRGGVGQRSLLFAERCSRSRSTDQNRRCDTFAPGCDHPRTNGVIERWVRHIEVRALIPRRDHRRRRPGHGGPPIPHHLEHDPTAPGPRRSNTQHGLRRL